MPKFKKIYTHLMTDSVEQIRINSKTVSKKSLDDITIPIKPHLNEFRQFFKNTIKTDVSILDTIIKYLLKQKGKELRPTLVFMSASLLGGVNKKSHVAATMVELLHTATLIHDDVVDEANSRRGFVSINKIWRNKAGVLLGDFLLAKGLQIALEYKEYRMLEIQSKAVQLMSEGELRQFKTASLFNMTEQRYFQIISEKTASLISTCCEVGAVSATSEQSYHKKMAEIGLNIGIAFQIRDDLFDYSMFDIGKPKRNDIQERKVTLPLIKALESAKKSERSKIRALMKKRTKRTSDVDRIVDFVHHNGGMEHAKSLMYEYANTAIDQIEQLPHSDFKQSFIELIHYIITRKK